MRPMLPSSRFQSRVIAEVIVRRSGGSKRFSARIIASLPHFVSMSSILLISFFLEVLNRITHNGRVSVLTLCLSYHCRIEVTFVLWLSRHIYSTLMSTTAMSSANRLLLLTQIVSKSVFLFRLKSVSC